jgi:hypothetical protein
MTLQHLHELNSRTPHTYKALTYLVPLMEDLEVNRKTLFGKDQTRELYFRFSEKLQSTVISMYADNIVAKSAESEEIIDKLIEVIQKFFNAHPNWPAAVSYANKQFIARRETSLQMLEFLFEENKGIQFERLKKRFELTLSLAEELKENYCRVCSLVHEYAYEGGLTEDEFYQAMDKHIDYYKKIN